MTAAATILAARAVDFSRYVGIMSGQRPREANFFAYFLSSLKESMIDAEFIKRFGGIISSWKVSN